MHEEVLNAQIRSGHTNSRTYNLRKDLDPISGWFWIFKSGAKVVGSWAHFASVL